MNSSKRSKKRDELRLGLMVVVRGIDVFGTAGTCCPIGNLVESANRCCCLATANVAIAMGLC